MVEEEKINFQPYSFEKVFIESTVATECFVKRDIEVDNECQWNSFEKQLCDRSFFLCTSYKSEFLV